MKSYSRNVQRGTTLKINQSVEGESIETKCERILSNKEPITDGAPITYTERKDGVLPGYNVRTDRFEVALEATTNISKSVDATRQSRMKVVKDDDQKGGNISGGAESTQGTK